MRRRKIRKNTSKRRFETSSTYLQKTLREMLNRRALFFFGKDWDQCPESGQAFIVFMVNFTLPEGMRMEYTPRALPSTDQTPTDQPKQ